MAGGSAPAGEDALRGQHSMNIVRFGFRPHHDDIPAALAPLLSQVCIEGGNAHCCTRRSVDAGGDHSVALDSLLFIGGSPPCGAKLPAPLPPFPCVLPSPCG